MTSLLDSRLLLVTGKGGVGKSTCAAALAVGASRAERKVLLLEMSYRAAAGEILQTMQPGPYPQEVRPLDLPGLHVARLDPQECLTEYLSEQLGSPRLVRLAADNRLLARLWRAMPSVDEMALLNAIYNHERATENGKPRFDNVIVDLPATGHALFMLGVPQGTLGIVRKGMGGIGRRAQEINTVLQDTEKTSVCVVTLPEELPVNETVHLVSKLDELSIQTSHVVINSILSELFERDQSQLLGALCERLHDGPGRLALNATLRREDRRSTQALRIQDLRNRVDKPLVHVPYTLQRGMKLVDDITAALMAPPERAAAS